MRLPCRTPQGVSQLADQIDALGSNLILSGSVGRGAGLGPVGLVRAMGASSWRVAQVFWVEGLALGGISWCLGALLGLPLASVFLQLFSRLVIPIDFVVDPLAFLVMLAALLLIVTLASVVPARRASSLHIADLLRYE